MPRRPTVAMNWRNSYQIRMTHKVKQSTISDVEKFTTQVMIAEI